jgi:hypothetical protein
MAAPSVQILVNDDLVKVFWEVDTEGVYSGFKLYYSNASTMAGEAAFAKTFINSPSSLYSSKHILFSFLKNSLGYGTSGFYMRLKGILASTGAEDTVNVGPTKYIPALNEDVPMNDVSKLYGYDATAKIWRKAIVTKDPASEGGLLDVT